VIDATSVCHLVLTLDDRRPKSQDREVAAITLEEAHPGFADPAYRARRDLIASAAATQRRGGRPPDVAYTDDERRTWSAIWQSLQPLHATRACHEYLDAKRALDLSGTEVPQLAELSERLFNLSGFTLER
jgi:phenylalanine-4-hydroxylase